MRLLRRRLLAAALAVSFAVVSAPSSGRAQDANIPTAAPKDGRIDGRRIPAYANSWRSYRRSPDGTQRPLAVWYDTVSVIRADGQEILRRVQWIVREDGTKTVLVNEAHRASLLPIRTVARPADGEPFIDLRFESRRISGRRMLTAHNGGPAGQVPVELSLELPQPIYDWRWWGLLVAAQPLEAGYAARFLAFATEANVEFLLIWITARVVGEEAGGRVPCWVVEVDAGLPWTLWIAKSRDQPPVQRIRILEPDGAALLWEPMN